MFRANRFAFPSLFKDIWAKNMIGLEWTSIWNFYQGVTQAIF